jgi:hypothetical protein
MSGAGVGGCTACGAAPEPWLVETATALTSWARATPNPKSRKQIDAASLVFMAAPQDWTVVCLLLFYSISHDSR